MKCGFLLSLILFFSCASQGTPSGGPVDTEGPIVIGFRFDSNSQGQEITIIFNEIINPSSAINSVKLNGLSNFDLKIKYNKIILSSINIQNDILELNISRHISDYQGNIMDAPIIKFFSKEEEITQNTISGKLINISDEVIYEIAIYEVYADSILYLKKTQADINGNFKFENIHNGKYRLAALDGIINDFDKNYRFNRYGINSQYININQKSSNTNIEIMMSEPLKRHSIIGANMINQNHAVVTLSDGLEKSIYIEPSKVTGDSVTINMTYFNRLEKYNTRPFSFIANVPEDTLYPKINHYFRMNDTLFINFSEPIQILREDAFIKDNKEPIKYNIIDFFNVIVPIEGYDKENIYINSLSIADLNSNVIDSLIALDISKTSYLKQKFGSLNGSLNYNGENDIVVRLTNNESLERYHVIVESGSFRFDEVIPGEYTLDSYELKKTDIETYYSGIWNPFEKSARFVIYPDYIDIRAHWTIEGINIIYD